MVEHKLERLLEHADRLLLLADGRVRAWGPPGGVLESGQLEACGLALPAHIRVAACLGARSASGSLPLTIEQTVAALRAAQPAVKASSFEPAAPAYREEPRSSPVVTAPSIALRGVSFAYPDGTRVFEGLSLAFGGVEWGGESKGISHVAAGSGPIALIGENGAGKTTLVKLIAGLLRPQSGEILIDGQTIRGQTAAQIARRVGLVFQNPDDQLFKSRALDEAMFGALNLGLPPREAERRAREALERVGLSTLAEENPYDLSLGQRKMLALASVLAMQTPILILDEPTIAQDHPGVERIGRLVRELQAEGRLVIVITHDMEFVASYCPQVVVLARGEVLAAGSTRAVFARPEQLRQAGLEPPSTLRLARALGLSATPLTPGEFIQAWQRWRPDSLDARRPADPP
ncbi:Energy-coupling factor transporter ATP-binding protein EcfA3 [bacterium HR26]|nr:Energy-coupling factor transporter ATP-binding protein EcfA3 [bacterium HR26]